MKLTLYDVSPIWGEIWIQDKHPDHKPPGLSFDVRYEVVTGLGSVVEQSMRDPLHGSTAVQIWKIVSAQNGLPIGSS